MAKRTVLGLVLCGCVAAAPAYAETKAEVLHWWTSGGESAAAHVLAEQYEKAGGVWVDTAIAGGEAARSAGINRIVGGHPPTAMQFNTGKQFDDLVASGDITPLDSVAAEGAWKQHIPAAFAEAITRDGHVYAVPINIHGQNWVWYNSALFAKNGITPPRTWDDVLATLDKLKAAGVVPLALGGQSWQEAILFNAVLLGAGGRDLYDAVYVRKDQAAMRSAGMRAVMDMFGKLRAYVDPGSPGRNWNDATAMVITGKAGMQVMGDWAKGEVIAAHLTPGKEVGCVLPGQAPEFLMGGDVFVFPKSSDPEQTKAQLLMAKVMIDPVTQVRFNAVKGSIPIRQDVDASSLDACAKLGLRTVADPAGQVANFDMLISADLAGSLRDVITQFWNTPSMKTGEFMDKFAQAFATAD